MDPTDQNIWVPGAGLVDSEYKPKPAYQALMKLIKGEWLIQPVNPVCPKLLERPLRQAIRRMSRAMICQQADQVLVLAFKQGI